MLTTDNFYLKKRFTYLALKLLAATATGVKAYAQLAGVWRPLFEETAKLRSFCFTQLVFSKFTFSCDSTPKAFGRKLRLPQTDKLRLRFMNDRAGEPFGIYNFALEYTDGAKLR